MKGILVVAVVVDSADDFLREQLCFVDELLELDEESSFLIRALMEEVGS